MRRLILIATLALTLAFSAVAQATTLTTYNDAVAGFEIAATSTTGVFTGTAGVALSGTWLAVVNHTPLPSSIGGTAAITAGSYFTLKTSLDGKSTNVYGTFNPGGAISFLSQDDGCRKQVYSVVGAFSTLLVNGEPVPGSGGSFVATLTHHRVFIFRRCITYAATVVGQVSLTF